MTHARKTGPVFFCALLAAAIACAGPAAPARAQEPAAMPAMPGLLDPARNAALYYWKAAALMLRPRTGDDLAFLRFVEEHADPLAPRVFSARPDVLRWLLNDRPMLAALEQAARQEISAFPVRIEGLASLDLSHLPALREVARRALVLAKAYEYVDNAEGAARVYADLLTLARHLDQDRNFASGFVAVDIVRDVTDGLEGFLSREQHVDAVSVLRNYFRDAPAHILHPAEYLRNEAERHTDFLLAVPDRAESRLEWLYGNAEHKPAMEQLVTLERKRKEQRLREWLDDYARRMRALAEACEMPYGQGVMRLREMDKEKAAMENDPSGGENPLVPLLVPTLDEIYQRFLLAEAQFDLCRILVGAALFRAETRVWPGSLDEISQYTHEDLPRDPFTGEYFYYRLSRDMPYVAVRVPKWMARRRDLLYRVNLGRRRILDEEAVDEAIEQMREDRRAEMLRAVPME